MNNKQYISLNEQFYDANEGFKKGNLSKKIYKPYKNYKEKDVIVKNDKDALLLFILKCDLAINDLTLYLDIHENDESAIKQLNHYKNELSKARSTYLDKYGPIMASQNTSPFKWNDEPIPWED